MYVGYRLVKVLFSLPPLRPLRSLRPVLARLKLSDGNCDLVSNLLVDLLQPRLGAVFASARNWSKLIGPPYVTATRRGRGSAGAAEGLIRPENPHRHDGSGLI